MKRLFEISAELDALIASIEECGGEIDETLEVAYILSEAELTEKAAAYAYVITEKAGQAETIASEIKRLQEKKKRLEADTERLKYYLLQAVEKFGKFEAGTFKFSTRESTAVDVINSDALPASFFRETVKYEPNKDAIKKALQAGEVVDGAVLVQNKNLVIK